MIPNFSRLKDGMFKEKGTSLPIHGFGRHLPWTLTGMNDTSLAMQLSSSEATRPMYPYEFTFTAQISAGEGTLTYTLVMENRGDEDMAIAPGFHPDFPVAQAMKSQLVTGGPPGFSAQDFDWVEHVPDNPYLFPHQVTIQFPGRGTLTIAEVPQDGQYALKNMQVWSEPSTRPDHDFVCFEPAVGREGALNRPADRLTIEPRSSRRIVLQLTATPA